MKDFLSGKRMPGLIYALISIILLIAIFVLLIRFAGNLKSEEEAENAEVNTVEENSGKLYENAVVTEETETVDTQVIEDGLRNMGELITEEYYFTQVETYSNTKKYLNLVDSTATFTYSYDGVVTAGIDCNDVEIKKDDEEKTITITIPNADIFSIEIDNDSFKVFEEKDGIFNKADLSMFNSAMSEYKKKAEEKAKEKGIIAKANEGAVRMIKSFAESILDTSDYKLEVVQER